MTVTAKFIDYNQILDDVKTLIETLVDPGEATRPFKRVGTNLQDRDFAFGHMPLADVRMSTADPGPRAGQDYFTPVTVEIEVSAVDLSSKDAAARITNELLAKCQRALVENSHFGASWESVLLGHVDFLYGEGEKHEGFAASAVMQVTISVYSDK